MKDSKEQQDAGQQDKPAKKETILSGMQPTGALHVGNLEGALKNWVKLQDDYWMYLCIVDLHYLDCFI